jgi:hypothetical protein
MELRHMTAEIITFEALRQKTYRAPPRTVEPRTAEPGYRSPIAKNEHLRRDRREAWLAASALSRYWEAKLDFVDAVSYAHRYGLKDARGDAETSLEDRLVIAEIWREAVGKQMLTPAPNMAEVTWKRQKLGKAFFRVDKERVEKSIADDIAFLDAHPTRNSVANKLRKGEVRS